MDSRCEIVDDYDHLEDGLEYVLENVIAEEVLKNKNECEESKQLTELFNTLLLNICKCNEIHQQQCLNCSHGANYIFDEKFQELVLSKSGKVRDLIYECSYMCSCKIDKCKNRLAQYGPRKFLKIVYSDKYCSKGLITTREIPEGAFICEYAGELLTREDAKKVIKSNELKRKMNYVLFLRETGISPVKSPKSSAGEILMTIVNPKNKGNIGRYLNHSCEPNCKIFSVRIDCPIPKICIFSKRCIKAGEEICFNYNEGVERAKKENLSPGSIPCLCGSKNCMKYLPNSNYS